MHKEENLSFSGSAEQHAPAQELQNLTPRNRVTVGRRSFIRGLGIVGATWPRPAHYCYAKPKRGSNGSRSCSTPIIIDLEMNILAI